MPCQLIFKHTEVDISTKAWLLVRLYMYVSSNIDRNPYKLSCAQARAERLL